MRVKLYSFFNLGARCGWVDSATSCPLHSREKGRILTVQEAGWAPGTVWTGAEKVVPTGIRSLDRPALSESPYRLSYTGPLKNLGTTSKFLAPKWWYKKKAQIGVCAPLG
jgi:hypothetical protein